MARERILFVSTHNAARSQMAEALLRNWGGYAFEALSAGTHATRLRPETIAVMAEVGIDVAAQRVTPIGAYAGQAFEWLITVCDTARQECPAFPGVQHTAHWGIDDPAKVEGDDAIRLAAYRAARDQIASRVRLLLRAASREELGHPSAETLPGVI